MGIEVAALEPVLDGAALLGLELEPRFRVLAATLEPTVDRYPWGEADDRRIQVLCFPVSTILASLRERAGDRIGVREFEVEQLVDVVAAMGGAPVAGPLFDRPEPRAGEWAPAFSMQGRSNAPDGRLHTVTLSTRHDDLDLDVFARFDEVEVKDPAGESLALTS